MTLYRDDAVGETRLVRTIEAASPEHGLVELRVERWSETETLGRAGDQFLARVTRIEPRLGGAFASLGLGPDGFLPFRSGKTPAGLHEGAAVRVEIAAEAAPGKGPRLRRSPDGRDAADGDAPRRLARAPSLAEAFPDAVTGPDAREMADLAEELALAREVALPGGGSLAIEPTRGLTAVDVDAGDRPGDDKARTVRRVNLAAAEGLARHVGLRGLSGLIVVDFVSTFRRADLDVVRDRLAAGLEAQGVKADLAPVSRFGVLELTVARTRRAIHEIGRDAATGAPSPETIALAALRLLESEAIADRGARLKLTAPAAVVAWLRADHIPWRAALTDRIGARFEVVAHDDPMRPDIEVSPL
ncbi:MAG: ribonuclease E/G [Maricaulaceae bacterium]|jgi:Ribonuclease G/E